jgi:hypothetical protein
MQFDSSPSPLLEREERKTRPPEAGLESRGAVGFRAPNFGA